MPAAGGGCAERVLLPVRVEGVGGTHQLVVHAAATRPAGPQDVFAARPSRSAHGAQPGPGPAGDGTGRPLRLARPPARGARLADRLAADFDTGFPAGARGFPRTTRSGALALGDGRPAGDGGVDRSGGVSGDSVVRRRDGVTSRPRGGGRSTGRALGRALVANASGDPRCRHGHRGPCRAGRRRPGCSGRPSLRRPGSPCDRPWSAHPTRDRHSWRGPADPRTWRVDRHRARPIRPARSFRGS